jgi:DNA polymerase-3 subunit delta
MRITSLSAFKRHLQDASPGHLSPIYLLLTKDALEMKIALDSLQEAFFAGSNKKSVAILEGESLRMRDLSEALESIDLFSSKCMVIIKNGEALAKPLADKIQSYIALPDNAICLVVTSPSMNRITTLYKSLEKRGIVFDAPEGKEQDSDLIAWISHYFFLAKKKASLQASQYLIQNCARDRYAILNEMDKLICFSGSQEEVSLSMAQQLLPAITQESIWQIIEMILAKNGAAARRIARKALAGDGEFFSFIRLIRSQLQTLAQIASILTHGGAMNHVQEEFPNLRGAILTKNVNLAQKASFPWLKDAILAVDSTELMAKNSVSCDYPMLVDYLLSKLILQL